MWRMLSESPHPTNSVWKLPFTWRKVGASSCGCFVLRASPTKRNNKRIQLYFFSKRMLAWINARRANNGLCAWAASEVKMLLFVALHSASWARRYESRETTHAVWHASIMKNIGIWAQVAACGDSALRDAANATVHVVQAGTLAVSAFHVCLL